MSRVQIRLGRCCRAPCRLSEEQHEGSHEDHNLRRMPSPYMLERCCTACGHATKSKQQDLMVGSMLGSGVVCNLTNDDRSRLLSASIVHAQLPLPDSKLAQALCFCI